MPVQRKEMAMESEVIKEVLLRSCLISLAALIGMGAFCIFRKARAEFFESAFSGLCLGVGAVATINIGVEPLGGFDLWDSTPIMIPIACAVSGWLVLWWKLRRRERVGQESRFSILSLKLF
jgi:hypothetical protein